MGRGLCWAGFWGQGFGSAGPIRGCRDLVLMARCQDRYLGSRGQVLLPGARIQDRYLGSGGQVLQPGARIQDRCLGSRGQVLQPSARFHDRCLGSRGQVLQSCARFQSHRCLKLGAGSRGPEPKYRGPDTRSQRASTPVRKTESEPPLGHRNWRGARYD